LKGALFLSLADSFFTPSHWAGTRQTRGAAQLYLCAAILPAILFGGLNMMNPFPTPEQGFVGMCIELTRYFINASHQH
jgi:hypothetical protein